MHIKEKIKKAGSYLTIWFIPSHTLLYVIIHDFYNIGIVDAYLTSGLISAVVMYPIINYIMHIGDRFKSSQNNSKVDDKMTREKPYIKKCYKCNYLKLTNKFMLNNKSQQKEIMKPYCSRYNWRLDNMNVLPCQYRRKDNYA